jgi:hypothetical protein
MAVKRTVQLFDARFMKGELGITKTGLFPKVTTAPASVVLPYHRNPLPGLDHASIVLFQREDPNVRSDTSVLKTVGSYVKEGETYEECAKRNCQDRLGITVHTLESLGEMLGYTNVHVQTRCFITDQWSIDESITLPPQFQRVEITLREAVEYMQRGKLLDEATTVPIMRLALRILDA